MGTKKELPRINKSDLLKQRNCIQVKGVLTTKSIAFFKYSAIVFFYVMLSTIFMSLCEEKNQLARKFQSKYGNGLFLKCFKCPRTSLIHNVEVIILDICRERTFVVYHTHLWSLRNLIMWRIRTHDIITVPVLFCFHIFVSPWDTYVAVLNALTVMHEVTWFELCSRWRLIDF